MVLDYVPRGDMSRLLKTMSKLRSNFLDKLEPETVRFYAAEMVNMLAYMKELRLAHRDLKP